MSAVALVVTQDVRAEREQQGSEIALQADALVITDAKTFTAAAAWLREVVAPLKRQIADQFRPRIEQAHALHKGLLADEKKFLGPVEQAEKLVRGRLAVYEQEQERKRQAELEAQRREQERLEAEERARVAAEAERLRKVAEDERLAKAAAAEAAGDREGAERLVSEPIVVAAPAPRPVFAPPMAISAPPRAAGVSFRDNWTADVTDLLALVKAVAEGKREVSLLLPNMPALNQMARALKDKLAIPGVRAVNERIAAQQRGR